MPVVHAKVSAVADEAGTTRVRPTDWNAGHTVMVDLGTEVTGLLPIANITGLGALATLNSVDLSGALATGILAAGRFPALTGDVTTVAGALATTLATVNPNVGSFGSATQVAQVTLNGKGLTTAASNVTITPAIGSITGLGTNVATFLATPSATNLTAAVTGDTIAYYGTNNAFTGAQTQTAGSYKFSDNIELQFGAIGRIYSDATNTIVDPISGSIGIGPVTAGTNDTGGVAQTGATKDLLVDQIGLGGSPVSSFFWINFTRQTTLGRGALSFDYNYTGTGLSLNILSKLSYNGTATNITALSVWGQAYLQADTSGSGTVVGSRFTTGFNNTSTTITAGGTKKMHSLSVEWAGDGGTHTSGAIYTYGVRIPTKAALTLAGATWTSWGVNSCNDIQVYDDQKFILGGSDIVKGDSYFIYNAASTDIDNFVNGTKTMTWDNDAVDSWLYHRFAGKMNLAAVAASTVEGDMWADSTQKTASGFIDGIQQQMPGIIFTQTADKTVANTVTETSIVGTGVGGLTLPANFFVAGKTVRITMSGIYSTVAVTGDTVTIKIKYGSTVLASKATTALVTGGTNLAWFADVLVTCRTTGATGTVQVSGRVQYQIAGSAVVLDEINNGAATTTLNTTTSNLFDVTVTHSAANASNTVKSLASSFEVLN